MSFEPSGVLTLTTDFGHKGPFVATMKGMMLTRFAGARIIDLTHEIVVHWPAEAGFWLERSYRFFPRGTVHVAVVDPGVGTERDIIVAQHDGHLFVAPDNGLLATIVGEPVRAIVHKIDLAKLSDFRITEPSATFHGRDIFAPIAADLASGKLALSDIGPRVDEVIPSWVDEPTVSPERVQGVVITVDNFGNLITNIDGSDVERFASPVIETGGRTIHIRRTYGDVKPGEYLALVNSFGVIEIARAEESAQEGLSVGRGAPVVLRDRN